MSIPAGVEEPDDEEFTEFLEKYSEWIPFLEQVEIKNPITKLFSKEGIQKIMTDDLVYDLLSNVANLPKWRGASNSKMYVAPNIPKKKLNNGISNDRFGVRGLLEETDVFVMVDEVTAIFAPKNGLMITNIGIFWRSMEYGSGAYPWRINDSRLTQLMMSSGFLLSELALEVDDDMVLPVGTTGSNHDEIQIIGGLISSLIEIANEQYTSSL